MSANFSTNIGDDYMQAMMEPGSKQSGIIDWSKPIELHEEDGAVHQVSLIGFDGNDLAVIRKVNYGQYIAYRKCDGSLAGGPAHRYVRNKVGV